MPDLGGDEGSGISPGAKRAAREVLPFLLVSDKPPGEWKEPEARITM